MGLCNKKINKMNFVHFSSEDTIVKDYSLSSWVQSIFLGKQPLISEYFNLEIPTLSSRIYVNKFDIKETQVILILSSIIIIISIMNIY